MSSLFPWHRLLICGAIIVALAGSALLPSPPAPKSVVLAQEAPAPARSCCAVEMENRDIRLSDARQRFIAAVVRRVARRIPTPGVHVGRVIVKAYEPHNGLVVWASRDSYDIWLDRTECERRTYLQLAGLIEHEFGHVLYYATAAYQLKARGFYDPLTYDDKAFFADTRYFNDGGGHPWDDSNELFASAFMLSSMINAGFVQEGVVQPPENARAFWAWMRSLPTFSLCDDLNAVSEIPLCSPLVRYGLL